MRQVIYATYIYNENIFLLSITFKKIIVKELKLICMYHYTYTLTRNISF